MLYKYSYNIRSDVYMNKNNKIDDLSALGYFWGFFFCFWLENLIKVGGIFKMTLKVLLSIL